MGDGKLFGAFLNEYVGSEESNALTVAALDKALGEVRGDNRVRIYEYRDGVRVPRPPLAWRIGEAMRAKVPSSSGAYTLYYCGHYEDFVGTLGSLRDPLEIAPQLEDALKTLSALDFGLGPRKGTELRSTFDSLPTDSALAEELKLAWGRWSVLQQWNERIPDLEILLSTVRGSKSEPMFFKRHLFDSLVNWIVGLQQRARRWSE